VDGWITVTTARGAIRAKAVIHSTNAFASHLLPEFKHLIMPERCSLAAVEAPAGFIKHTGAQHWDATVNVGDQSTVFDSPSPDEAQNYHLQLPEPYNAIILGGGRQLLVHKAEELFPNDEDNKQFEGMAEFFAGWGVSDVKDWPGPKQLSRPADDGGCWTGSMSRLLMWFIHHTVLTSVVETSTADSWPFVGPLPDHDGQFIAAGFCGHGMWVETDTEEPRLTVAGMPRILLSTAHVVPLVLDSLGMDYKQPALAAPFPALPKPFHATAERIKRLQAFDLAAKIESYRADCEESARKPFCMGDRSKPMVRRVDSPVE
jgi:hypothetical protein